eukprot:INCI4323.1.p1 GENE.INCI4323.1~~INCI4323.1.p1  ORF type:complete len:1374 (-),score=283.91 INCI4323.1:144-4265(-)
MASSSLKATLQALRLSDASDATCKTLFASRNKDHEEVAMLEDIAPSKSSFSSGTAWPAHLDFLNAYFEKCLEGAADARPFWDVLQACQAAVEKPHQQLVAVLFDRVRLGCYTSAIVCLRWFSLAGGMQGLDTAKGVLLGEIFCMLKLGRIESFSDTRGRRISGDARIAEAVESFTGAVETFLARQNDLASAPSSLLVNYVPQMFAAMDKLGPAFNSGAQSSAEGMLTKLAALRVNGRHGFLVTPIIEKLVAFVTMPDASKRPGGVDTASKVRHEMALRVLESIAARPSAADRVFALIRHISRRPPAKADFRRLAVNGIETLLGTLPEEKQKQFLSSIWTLAASKLLQHRVFAVEIADRLHSNKMRGWWRMDCFESGAAISKSPAVQEESESESRASDFGAASPAAGDSEVKQQSMPLQWEAAHLEGRLRQPLIFTLVDRVRDKVPQVRKAAIKGLVNALDSADADYVAEVIRVVEIAYAADTAAAVSAVGEDGLPLFDDADGIEHPVMTMVLNRLEDDKTSVRSCAVKLAEIFGSVDAAYCNFTAIAHMCEDLSVSVRRQAITTIAFLGRKHQDNSELQETWLQCVLSRVKDNERTVQTLCASIIHESFFLPLIAATTGPALSSSTQPAAPVRRLLAMVDNLDLLLLSCLQQATAMLIQSGDLSQDFVAALKSTIPWSAHMATVAWALLQEIAATGGKKLTVDPDFVILAWENSVDENTISEQTASFILGTLVHVIDFVSGHAAVSLADHLLDLLQGFRCTPGLITSLVKCSIKLSDHNADGNAALARKQKAAWMGKLVKRCDTCLRNFVFSKRELNSDAVVAHLHTLGELALVGVRDTSVKPLFTIPDSTIASLKTLVAPSTSDIEQRRQSATDVDGAGALSIKAFAFVALGKVAFRSQPLAKSCIGVFIRELMTAPHAVLRNNILIVLGDLCRHFTGLVDPYVGNMAQCLGDSHIGVRKNALLLLTELLLEDFIKWRGPLLFQFLTVLLDDSDELRDLAHQAVFGLFSGRDKNLVANRFVSFVHVLNNSSLARSEMDGADAASTSAFFQRFYGQGAGRRSRYHLYRAVLSEMDSVQKFQVSARLTVEVLGATVDGTLSLNGNDPSAVSYNVLQDSLAILSSKAIQIPHGSSGAAAAAAGAASAMGEEVSAETAVGAVTDKLISKISHKNAMQNTIPVLIALRARLQETRSPLLRDLNSFMTSIFRTHRADLMKALAEDPQLAAEIKYDLQKFDEAQKQRQSQKRRRRSSGMGMTPTPHKLGGRPAASGGLATPFSARRSAVQSPLSACSVAKVSGGSVVTRRVSRSAATEHSSIARNLDMANVFSDSSNTATNVGTPQSATKTRPNGATRSPALKRVFRDGDALVNLGVSD